MLTFLIVTSISKLIETTHKSQLSELNCEPLGVFFSKMGPHWAALASLEPAV